MEAWLGSPRHKGISTESVRGIWQASMQRGDARHLPTGHAPRGPRYDAWFHGGGDERRGALAGFAGFGEQLGGSKKELGYRSLPACQPWQKLSEVCGENVEVRRRMVKGNMLFLGVGP